MGQYHTIDIEMNQSIKLEKDCWDTISLERLDESCDPAAKADLAAVVMQEGLSNICLITSTMTIVRTRIERRIPKKNQVSLFDCLFVCCLLLLSHMASVESRTQQRNEQVLRGHLRCDQETHQLRHCSSCDGWKVNSFLFLFFSCCDSFDSSFDSFD